MENRSPVSVFFLGIFTATLYHLMWLAKTKGEMNARGADIPTAWMLLFILPAPIWVWKYCQGVAKVTNGGTSAVMALLLFPFAGPFGPSILQSQFNKVGVAAAAPTEAPAAAAPPPPAPAEEPAAAEEEPLAAEEEPTAAEEEPAAAEEQESADDDEEKSET